MNSTFPKQAIILAGGKCSRFIPLDNHGSKSNFFIIGKTIIERTVDSLIEANIRNIHIVKSNKDTQIEKSLEKYKTETHISFYNQQKSDGQANALLQITKKFDSNFLVINQQQINIKDNLKLLENFLKNNLSFPKDSIFLFHQKTNTPEKYGIVQLENNKVTKVEEKPEHLKNTIQQRIIGIYCLTPEFIEKLKELKNEEYQLETCLDIFAKQNKVFSIENNIAKPTLKYIWDIFSLTNILFNNLKKNQIHKKAQIHKTAIITGPVIIEKNAQIHEYTLIKGPCYIGKNVIIGSFCKVRDKTILEENGQLQNNVEITRSYIGKNSTIHSGFIGDSIIGSDVKIGAGFITANRRLDRKNILIKIKNKLVDTQKNSFGCLIGNNVKIGIHCGTNPGTIIKSNQIVFPNTIVK